MINLRPGRLARAATLSSFLVLVAGAAHATTTEVLVGVKSVRFAWTPAAGSPTGYLVSRSLNLGAYQAYATTVQPEIVIPVKAGDKLSIRVAATGYDSAGVYRVGPESANSNQIAVAASPVYPVTGSWLLRCPTCNLVNTRSLSDASLVLAQAPGLNAPWNMLGVAKLQYGRDQIIWHNQNTGAFAIYDGQFLAPITSLANTGPAALRAAGAADVDGDGDEEFVVQRGDTNAVEVWGIAGGRFSKIGSMPSRTNSILSTVDDFDNNGQIDLLWRDTVAGTLDLWMMAQNPMLALPVSSLLKQSVRLVSALSVDAAVAETGDYDGNGFTDVLWRYADGRLVISYLSAGLPQLHVTLTAVTGDIDRRVAGSVDIGGTAGEEIALQDKVTGLIWILDPSISGTNTRTKVLHPGSEWKVSDVSR